MGPVAMMALAQGVKALGSAAPGIIGAIPGKMERNYRQQIVNDERRLAGGAGGMAEGKRQAAIAEGMAGVQAQQEQELARVTRGGATQSGASGLQGEMAGAIHKAGLGAGNQVRSAVRQEDLDLAEARRQDLHQRMLNAYQMGQVRKKAAIEGLSSADLEGFSALGKKARLGAASDVANTTKIYGA
jgi:hypothetical protein